MLIFEIILDVLLAAVLVIGIFTGYKKGFIKAISKPVAFVTSIATAFWLCDPISRYLFEPMISTPITNQIKSYLIDNCPQITPESASDELPTLLKFAASILNVDISTLSPENTISEIVDSLASPIVHLISVVLTFIIVFFIAKLFFTLLLKIISAIFNSGTLGLPNKILGSIFCFIFSAALAWLFCVGFDFIIHSSLFEGTALATEFSGGPIYSFFNRTNPVDILLGF